MRSIATTLRRTARRGLEALRRAQRTRVSRQKGFALLVVMVTAAVLGAVVTDFGYNARVDFEAAANARDQLRAEYVARSGVNLARLLIKVQQAVVDPINRATKMDFQIADFAGMVLAAFGGEADERKGLGELLGMDTDSIKGLGLGKGATFDISLGTEDGKININCAGQNAGIRPTGAPVSGVGPGQALSPCANTATRSALLYCQLVSIMTSPRYNRLFERQTPDGQYVTRDDMARAIIDWTDLDEVRFDPLNPQGSSGGEDYRYETLADPFKAHHNYFDTLEELNLVRGFGDEMFGSFASMFTVYGSPDCKVNLSAIADDHWPIRVAVMRATAKDPNSPLLADDVMLSALSQNISMIRQLLPGTVQNIEQYCNLQTNPASVLGKSPQTLDLLQNLFPNVPGLAPDCKKLAAVAKIDPLRRFYRIESTGSIKRPGDRKIQVRIKAVFDVLHPNFQTTSADPNDRVGAWVYWRVE